MVTSSTGLPPTACLAAPINTFGGMAKSAINFGILGIGLNSGLNNNNANVQLSSGPLQVNGTTPGTFGGVGIGLSELLHLSGGAQLQSALYADPTSTVQVDGGSSFTGGENIEPAGYFAALQTEAINLSNLLYSQTPTQTYSQINNTTTTFTGNGGLNVINVTGQFQLSGQQLTISGGANDKFIINVLQGMQLSGGSSVNLVGVSPTQVIFNFPKINGQNQLQTSGKANTAAIYLAPSNQQMQINGGVHNSEFISGGQLWSASGQSGPCQ